MNLLALTGAHKQLWEPRWVVAPVDRIRLHERSQHRPQAWPVGESGPLGDFEEAGRLTTSLPLDRSASTDHLN